MDEQIQHDPRTKLQIKESIFNFLYSPVLKKLQWQLDEIGLKNSIAQGNGIRVFIYKGETYTPTGAAGGNRPNRLHKQLYCYMDEYLKEVQSLNNFELPYVLGYIGQVLNASNHLNDYLQLFPESVHTPIKTMIANCPCKSIKLTPEGITEFNNRNKVSISLLKQRLVTNLLI